MRLSDRRPVDRREDDFADRRRHLADLSDEQLAARFWELTTEIARPLVELARGHTSPSVERSVLLRMGFSSIEAKGLVERVAERGLLGKGAGHVVLAAAKAAGLDARFAGLELLKGRLWDSVTDALAGGGPVP